MHLPLYSEQALSKLEQDGVLTFARGNAATPLLVDSPHSGRRYPKNFDYICDFETLRQAEDAYVDELVAGASKVADVVCALFPRSYIDTNRAENDIDPAIISGVWPHELQPSARTLTGLGLVRRLCRNTMPMYRQPLPASVIQQRIENYYRPYHALLQHIHDSNCNRFGVSWHVNCHSMPSKRLDGVALDMDFVIGDRDSTSCASEFSELCAHILIGMGYRVAFNFPFKGLEIAERYGKPEQGRHVVQLEINRALYMCEQKTERSKNFDKLKSDLDRFFAEVAKNLPVLNADTLLAAE